MCHICINNKYQFIKPFLDKKKKMSIFEEYGAFKEFYNCEHGCRHFEHLIKYFFFCKAQIISSC